MLSSNRALKGGVGMLERTLIGNVFFDYGVEEGIEIRVKMMNRFLGRIVDATSNGNVRQGEMGNLIGRLINTQNGVIFLPNRSQNAEFTSAR